MGTRSLGTPRAGSRRATATKRDRAARWPRKELTSPGRRPASPHCGDRWRTFRARVLTRGGVRTGDDSGRLPPRGLAPGPQGERVRPPPSPPLVSSAVEHRATNSAVAGSIPVPNPSSDGSVVSAVFGERMSRSCPSLLGCPDGPGDGSMRRRPAARGYRCGPNALILRFHKRRPRSGRRRRNGGNRRGRLHLKRRPTSEVWRAGSPSSGGLFRKEGAPCGSCFAV